MAMSHSVAKRLDAVERKPLKYGEGRTSETFVRGGRIFEAAREASGFSKEQAADHYGVSPSLMTRQTQNVDNQHLSFQRICEMPPKFRRELIAAMSDDLARDDSGVVVRKVIEFRQEKLG
jgi:hypothetical protein